MRLSASLLVAALLQVESNDAAPNFIVMQPDDLQFYEAWGPPAHLPGVLPEVYPVNSSLPFMNLLRQNGMQMMNAYTASPKCGTSRYSTMTGRYASRSSFSRLSDANLDANVSLIGIPTTKLEDLPDAADGMDCSVGNLASLFQGNGYRTGVVGKWHLLSTRKKDSYQDIQESIRSCGFNYTEAIYKENIANWTNDEFHHNMEHVASRAVQFIETTPPGTPFFLYANPTVPHAPGIYEALIDFNCTDSVEGPLPEDDPVFNVPGMTADYGGDCKAYRQSILDRAHPSIENKDLGSIWADDTVGAIYKALEAKGELDNTFFLYQMDHGQENKDTLYEQGVRIAQFVHYPNGNFHSNKFHGVVSTIDIGPTMMEIAGITDHYAMDGNSWAAAAQSGSDFGDEDRCIFSEIDRDRTVTCGCDKYIRIYDVNNTNFKTVSAGLKKSNKLDFAGEMLFDMCGDISSDPQGTNLIADKPVLAEQLSSLLDCHIAKTNPTKDPHYVECTTGPASPTPPPTQKPSAAPTEVDLDVPEIGQHFPADGEYLGNVSSYIFEAEVTDASKINWVEFEFEKPDGTMTGGVRVQIDPESQLYTLDMALDQEGTWKWKVLARDAFRNTNRGEKFQSFAVARSPTGVAKVVRNVIKELIAENPPLGPKFVRMGFHDCVGGCDGCIDMNNADNKGLQEPIDALVPIVAKYESADVSRADVWAIAALVACDVALPLADRGRFPTTHIGRRNCDGGDEAATGGPDRHLPGPDLTTHEILQFFEENFGFDAQETVAIMGSHSLGRMHAENSGFEGQWTEEQFLLDNRYYQTLVGGREGNVTLEEMIDAPAWHVTRRDNTEINMPNRTEWTHNNFNQFADGLVMTSSDIALVRDLNPDNTEGGSEFINSATGEVFCSFNELNRRGNTFPRCPHAQATIEIVSEYKLDNDKFVDDFERVMGIMVNAGYLWDTCELDTICILGVEDINRRGLRGKK